MHPNVRALVPCILKCEEVETALSAILGKLPLTDKSIESNRLGRTAFSHEYAKGEYSLHWGISFFIDPTDRLSWCDSTSVYVWFFKGETHLLALEYDKEDETWQCSTPEAEMQQAEEFGQFYDKMMAKNPANAIVLELLLDLSSTAEEVPALSTEQALRIISSFATQLFGEVPHNSSS